MGQKVIKVLRGLETEVQMGVKHFRERGSRQAVGEDGWS